jgi:hypothetical protein
MASGNRHGQNAALLASIEILAELHGVSLRIGQGHVAVWPDEIKSIAPETGAAHCRLPWEDMKR